VQSSQSPMSLSGKTIVITGAAQGIGQAIALRALNLGANVAAIDMNRDALDALHATDPKRVLGIYGDVVDPDLAGRAIHETVSRFGNVDGLVNNAGVTRTALIEKMTLEQWQTVVDVHLTGSFQMLQAVGRQRLTDARAGNPVSCSIVNVSSDAGRRGTIGQINYAAAKSGVLGLTMSAAREWAKYGIRVNSLGSGVIETPMTETIRGDKFKDNYLSQIPMNRFGNPDEVAGPACFLLSNESSYITGQHLWVNGGMTINV
jgi:3-oxoacyl-[acyl-carrier protein] reductase